MRKTLCNILALLIFVAGLAVFIFPVVNKMMIDSSVNSALESFESMRNENHKSDKTDFQQPVNKIEYKKLLSDMKSYNKNLYRDGQKDLVDVWSYEQSGFDLGSYGMDDSLIATIRIPAMNCKLPMYLGATKSNMARGVAQLGETSIPVGGKNTNCVIAGHRGSAGGEFFLYIENLKKGDKVYIDNFWETLEYKVTKTAVIEPDDMNKVLIQPHKDMITLVTCHPYPYNSQRYLVYCERTKIQNSNAYVEDNSISDKASPTINSDSGVNTFILFEKVLYILIPLLLVALSVIILIKQRKNST